MREKLCIHRDRGIKIPTPSRKCVARFRGRFGGSRQTVFFNTLSFAITSAICIKRYRVDGTTANYYGMLFNITHLIRNQNVVNIIPNR